MMNARFWHFQGPEPDDVTKLTLSPGQTLTWYTGRNPCDEGWSSEMCQWTFDGVTITRSWCFDGTDCDGRLTRTGSDECRLSELAATPDSADPDKPYQYPNWKDREQSQRDYSAESMGY